MKYYLLTFDLDGRPWPTALREMQASKTVAELLPFVWVLQSQAPADRITDAVRQHLAEGQTVVVQELRDRSWGAFIESWRTGKLKKMKKKQ